jgi:hypothetical protein
MTLPNLKGVKPNHLPIWKMKLNGQPMTKELFRDLIFQCHGIITLVCSILDCNYHQFYLAVKHWKLEEDLKQAKEMLISDAEAALFNSLSSKTEQNRLRAADTILKHCAPHPSQEITVKAGDVETTVKNIFGVD